MALALCNTVTDEKGRELVRHGTTAFPIACYDDDLGKDPVPWHWHDEWEAAIITEGRAVICAGNERYTLCAGEGFFINSGILHGAWQTGATRCRLHSLVFHPRLVGGSLDSVYFQNYVRPLMDSHAAESVILRPDVAWQSEVLAWIESAWQDAVAEPTGYEFAVRNALSQAIFSLYSHLPAADPTADHKSLRDGERIKLMLQFIHDRFADELDTKAIAASAAISESEALRCFHATIGTTPIRYLKDYRIQRAAHRMLTTNDRIADIAAACGFQDVSYFTKSFREAKGCAPTKFRRENWDGGEKNEGI